MRFTIKEENSGNYYLKNPCHTNEDMNKWGQLEDSEEKIGIDLNILVRIITDDIYIKSGDVIAVTDRPTTFLFMDGEWLFEVYVPEFMEIVQCYLSEFGKTWALTKEGL